MWYWFLNHTFNSLLISTSRCTAWYTCIVYFYIFTVYENDQLLIHSLSLKVNWQYIVVITRLQIIIMLVFV